MKFKNFEALLQHCRDLRIEFERDEARFFLGLWNIEENLMEFLRLNGYDVFARFLRNHDLCEPSRYAAFKAGLEHLSSTGEALQIGAKAVMALSAVCDVNNVPAYVGSVKAFKQINGGTLPSEQTAKRLLRQVDPRKEIPKAVSQATETARLRAELQAIKVELRAKDAEVRTWKARAEKAEKALGRLKDARVGSPRLTSD